MMVDGRREGIGDVLLLPLRRRLGTPFASAASSSAGTAPPLMHVRTKDTKGRPLVHAAGCLLI